MQNNTQFIINRGFGHIGYDNFDFDFKFLIKIHVEKINL